MLVWKYRGNGTEFGPVTGKQLIDLAAQGQLKPTDLVWREGLSDWVSASTVKGLFAAASTLPVTTAPPGSPANLGTFLEVNKAHVYAESASAVAVKPPPTPPQPPISTHVNQARPVTPPPPPDQLPPQQITTARVSVRPPSFKLLTGWPLPAKRKLITAVAVGIVAVSLIAIIIGGSSHLPGIRSLLHSASRVAPYSDLSSIYDAALQQFNSDLQKHGKDFTGEALNAAQRFCNDKLASRTVPPIEIDQSAADQFRDANIRTPSVADFFPFRDFHGLESVIFTVAMTTTSSLSADSFNSGRQGFIVEVFDTDDAIIAKMEPGRRQLVTIASDLRAGERGVITVGLPPEVAEKVARFRIAMKSPNSGEAKLHP